MTELNVKEYKAFRLAWDALHYCKFRKHGATKEVSDE